MPDVSPNENFPPNVAKAMASVGRVIPARVLTLVALPTGTFAAAAINIKGNYLDTFTVTATGTLTVDGVVLAANDIVAVFGQATATQNGIYIVATAGASGVAAVLRRAELFGNSTDLANVRLIATSNEGLQNSNKLFMLNLPATSAILDTTPLSVTLLAGGGGAATSTPPFYARAVVTALSGTYTGSTTNTLTSSAASAFGTQDGVSTLAVGDVVLLPAGTNHISAASDAGPWVIGTLGSVSVDWVLNRPAWWNTGDVFGQGIPTGASIRVGPEGTQWKNTNWQSWAAPAQVVDTNDPLLYPNKVTVQATLLTGSASVTISSVPIRLAAATGVLIDYISGAAKSTTVGYAPTTITPGAIGTASLVISAMIAGMTAAGSGDVSVVNVTVFQ